MLPGVRPAVRGRPRVSRRKPQVQTRGPLLLGPAVAFLHTARPVARWPPHALTLPPPPGQHADLRFAWEFRDPRTSASCRQKFVLTRYSALGACDVNKVQNDLCFVK